MTHTLGVRVYYEDTDMAGIVYYANYLKYIERARSELVEEMGLNQRAMKEDDGIVFVVRRVEADYLGAARLDDRLQVRTTHWAEGRAKWVFDQEVWRDDALLFKAKVLAVCMTVAGRPARLPEALRARLDAAAT